MTRPFRSAFGVKLLVVLGLWACGREVRTERFYVTGGFPPLDH